MTADMIFIPFGVFFSVNLPEFLLRLFISEKEDYLVMVWSTIENFPLVTSLYNHKQIITLYSVSSTQSKFTKTGLNSMALIKATVLSL